MSEQQVKFSAGVKGCLFFLVTGLFFCIFSLLVLVDVVDIQPHIDSIAKKFEKKDDKKGRR